MKPFISLSAVFLLCFIVASAHGDPLSRALSRARDLSAAVAREERGEMFSMDDLSCHGFPIETDGRAPSEVLTDCQLYTPCGPMHTIRLFHFRSGPRPEIIGELEYGEYMESGWIEIVDLDDDGREEALIVGDTTGVEPSDLYVLAEQDGALFQRAPDEVGIEYVHFDVDQDGVQEIIALGEGGIVRLLRARRGGRFELEEAPVTEAFQRELRRRARRNPHRPTILLPLLR